MCEQCNQALTWEDQIRHHDVFPLIGIADLWQVGVQHEEGNTSQEGHNTSSHAKAASAVIAVEDAHGVVIDFGVDVSLCSDGGKHHDGEELQERNNNNTVYPIYAPGKQKHQKKEKTRLGYSY